jgi:hypothetical protein
LILFCKRGILVHRVCYYIHYGGYYETA